MYTRQFQRKTLFHLTTFIILILLSLQFSIHRVEAAESGVYSLSDNGTYSKYDITGDGKKDTLKIKTKYSKEETKTVRSIKIQINNKTAFKKEYEDYEIGNFSIDYKIIRLKNGNCLLFIRDYGASENYNFNAVFKYSKGKLSPIITNDKTISARYNYGCTFKPEFADGNIVELKFQLVNNRLGVMDLYILYEYKNGTLERASDYANDFAFSPSINDKDIANKRFTLSRGCKIYTTSKCKTESFSMKKGEKIKATKLKVTNGKIYMKVKRVSNGKTGWIKCNEIEINHKSGTLFKECDYAG